MCCTRLVENTGCKKSAKNRHLGTIAQLYRAISLQLRHISTIGKKLVKQQYLFHMSLQYGELWPNSLDLLASLGHPSKFQLVLRLGLLLHRRRSAEVNKTLQGVWPSHGLVHYIYIFGSCCPVTEFCEVQNLLCVFQVLRCPISAALLLGTRSGREPNLAALSTRRHLYSAGRPSRWALAHIVVRLCFSENCWLLVFLCFIHCLCRPHLRNIYV